METSMQVASRRLVYVAILVLAVGFSVLTDVSDIPPTYDQAKVRCAWPAGDTSHHAWYVEDVGGAESERPEGQSTDLCVGIQAF